MQTHLSSLIERSVSNIVASSGAVTTDRASYIIKKPVEMDTSDIDVKRVFSDSQRLQSHMKDVIWFLVSVRGSVSIEFRTC